MDGLVKALKTEGPLLVAAICVFIATLVCLHSNLILPAHWRETPINWQNLATKPHWVTGRLTATRIHPDNPDRMTLYLDNVTGYQAQGMPKTLALGFQTNRLQKMLIEQNPSSTAVIPTGQAKSIGIAAQILLFPPDAPSYPGDRDYRPFSRYTAQTGHGYIQGRAALTSLPPPPIDNWQLPTINSFRADITSQTKPLAQGVVTALLNGDMSGVPPEVNNAYRNAGLSHLLAISGMQLSVAGMGVFWLVRRLLACWPRLALTHNIRLYAALVGLAVVPLYTLIAGSGVSVIRSALMVAFFLSAVIAGRVSGSLRAWSIALAGMCLVWPESALTAGFQLSFAATLGLILAQAAGLLSAPHQQGRGQGRIAWFLGHIRQIAITSLIAGLSTLPLVAYIFGQVSLVSLPANLIAVPLMGGLGTWLSLIVLALWPLHLAPLTMRLIMPLLVWVCIATNAIAAYSAHLPQALVIVPQNLTLPLTSLCLIAFLLCCICEWIWAVCFTFAIFGLAAAASLTATAPTLVVLKGGEIVLFRTSERQFNVISAPLFDTTSARWAQRWGYTLEPQNPQPGQCDSTGCTYQTPKGPIAVLTGAPTADDCHRAILIISNQSNALCPQKIFLKTARRWAYYP